MNQAESSGCRRRHSNSTTPVATETFSDAMAPAIGMRTSTSQCFLHQLVQTMALAAEDENGRLRVIDLAVKLARRARPVHKSRSRVSSDPRAFGSRCPREPRAGVRALRRQPWRRFPSVPRLAGPARSRRSAPAACAVRMMAPRLCGSSTPSRTISNCAPAKAWSSSA